MKIAKQKNFYKIILIKKIISSFYVIIKNKNSIREKNMNLKVKNYKNISNLNLDIEDNKINYIFGISGSGKSSIVNAVIGDTSEKNITYGKKIGDMELVLSPTLKEDDYLIFNENTHQKFRNRHTGNCSGYCHSQCKFKSDSFNFFNCF